MPTIQAATKSKALRAHHSPPPLASEGSESPSVVRGAGGKAPLHLMTEAWGRCGRVKGPCPRPCGAAGRTNPLTRPPLRDRAVRFYDPANACIAQYMQESSSGG